MAEQDGMDDRERVQVESRTEWREWLARNHERAEGVWLVRFKKHKGDKYVSDEDAIDEALCFGWIDSLPRKLDEDRTMLWFAPRKAGSNWSKRNKERVAILIESGRMTPAGLAKIDAAKQDGTWTALDTVEALEIPADLAAEFNRYGAARQNFDAFPRSVKRGILEWILNAKRPETRAKRIAETARLAEQNIRANQWRA
jgi:uncharacterized protein YdeI (YjbR/CyaY-like superfamily)